MLGCLKLLTFSGGLALPAQVIGTDSSIDAKSENQKAKTTINTFAKSGVTAGVWPDM